MSGEPADARPEDDGSEYDPLFTMELRIEKWTSLQDLQMFTTMASKTFGEGALVTRTPYGVAVKDSPVAPDFTLGESIVDGNMRTIAEVMGLPLPEDTSTPGH